MNPRIWGPPLWRIMTDVAYKADRVQNERVVPYAVTFFKSLAFLLPCKYCRQSYRQYITNLDVSQYASRRNLVKWVWDLKEKVNDKLKKSQDYRLPYPVYLRRVNSVTHSASPDDVFDFLSVLGLNYKPSEGLKQKYMLMMISVLPLVLPYPRFSEFLMKHPIQIQDLATQETYLAWLYRLRQKWATKEKLPPLPPQHELYRRYQNIKAEQKEPLACQYVLDDPTTWNSEIADKCRKRQ